MSKWILTGAWSARGLQEETHSHSFKIWHLPLSVISSGLYRTGYTTRLVFVLVSREQIHRQRDSTETVVEDKRKEDRC